MTLLAAALLAAALLPGDEPAGVLVGKVVIEPGDAAPRGPVEVTFFPEVDGRGRTARTAADGTFRIGHLPEPVKGMLFLHGESDDLDAMLEAVEGRGEETVLLRVRRSDRLEVRVVNDSRRPILEDRVTASWNTGTGDKYSSASIGGLDIVGRLDLKLREPTAPLTVTLESFGHPAVSALAVLDPGRGVWEAQIHLPPPPTLAVTVTGPDGKPLPGAPVVATFVVGPRQDMAWREDLFRGWFEGGGGGRLLHYDYRRTAGGLDEVAVVGWTADGEGRALLDPVLVGAACSLAATAPGRGAVCEPRWLPSGGGEEETTLAPLPAAPEGPRLRLVGADGPPPPGLSVLFQRPPADGDAPRTFPAVPVDGEGGVRVPFAPAEGERATLILLGRDRWKRVLHGVALVEGAVVPVDGGKRGEAKGEKEGR